MLGAHLPNLRYSAALIGSGSEVLGLDTEMSADHDWGPRAMLFVSPDDLEASVPAIRRYAMQHLPAAYRDYPIRFYSPDRRDIASRHRLKPGEPGLEPRIEVFTVDGFVERHLGLQPGPPSVSDWLTIPHYKLGSFVGGRVFHDDVGLQESRDRFRWYPHDVWLYLMAACWHRIGTDELMAGRAGSAGDELGSSVIAHRLIRDVMRLAFLMEKSYPPYSKWIGSAFAQLRCADELLPLLEHVSSESDWQARDHGLAEVCAALAAMHNALGVTSPVASEPRRLWERPFTVIGGGSFARVLTGEISDTSVRSLADTWLIGSIDLLSDSHALDDDVRLRSLLFPLYEPVDSPADP
jgi:hypothetical protein